MAKTIKTNTETGHTLIETLISLSLLLMLILATSYSLDFFLKSNSITIKNKVQSYLSILKFSKCSAAINNTTSQLIITTDNKLALLHQPIINDMHIQKQIDEFNQDVQLHTIEAYNYESSTADSTNDVVNILIYHPDGAIEGGCAVPILIKYNNNSATVLINEFDHVDITYSNTDNTDARLIYEFFK
jgi:hypothetical protein